jgi:4-amino-4-deoxy-L-arabinose transferase-like glycosyltransferase
VSAVEGTTRGGPEAVIDEAGTTARAVPRDRSRRVVAALVMSGVGVLLTLAFLPLYFDKLERYDDEGSLLVAIRRFLEHGSLYDHTHGSYGPFYFSVNGAIFKVFGDPTQFRGRVVVLLITALTVIVFAATVWRVTRSVVLSVLCEVAAFVVLIPDAGLSPIHPGAFVTLLVAALGYELVAYATDRRTYQLVLAGAALGGLLMTKVNVGLFAIAAVVVIFVIGNPRHRPWLRWLVGIGAVLLPFAVTSQRLYLLDTAQFAGLVSVSMLYVFVPLTADEVAFPPRAFLSIGAAMVATMLASCIWPLLSGTSPVELFRGVFIQPLDQVENLAFAIHPDVQWLAIVVTLAVLYAVMAVRRRGLERLAVQPPWLLDAALALAALIVLGLGLFGGVAAWLPAIAVLPALAYLAHAPRRARLALRVLVPVAILQMLHVYPVPGAQKSWALVAICAPCVIALWAGVRALPAWRATTRAARVLTGGALCVVLVIAAGPRPDEAWRDYLDARPLRLPGTHLIRLSAHDVVELRELVDVIRNRCDAFYSAPGFAGLYILTGLPAPTGQLANFPGVLNEREQRDLASQLHALEQQGARVCIVRHERDFRGWLRSSYGNGPLGEAVARYQRRVGRVNLYTVSRLGPAPAAADS